MTQDAATTEADTITLTEAMTLAWHEADLLDGAGYDEWLALWMPAARYVVPIEPAETDFENALNYAYDDDALRRKRVERLRGGQSVSATPVARTIRLLSRFRLLGADAAACELRCAQFLTEFRRGRERSYVADVTFRLVRDGSQLRIDRKIVRLINAADGLTGISYIL